MCCTLNPHWSVRHHRTSLPVPRPHSMSDGLELPIYIPAQHPLLVPTRIPSFRSPDASIRSGEGIGLSCRCDQSSTAQSDTEVAQGDSPRIWRHRTTLTPVLPHCCTFCRVRSNSRDAPARARLPTEIQAEACPLILGGGDVLMAAETGRGKTGAFCLPVLQIVYETRRAAFSGGAGAAVHSQNRKKAKTVTQIKMNPEDRDPMFAIAPDGLLCQVRRRAAPSRVRSWNKTHSCPRCLSYVSREL